MLDDKLDFELCHICKHPKSGIGSWICSAPHLASRQAVHVDKLKEALTSIQQMCITVQTDPNYNAVRLAEIVSKACSTALSK